MHLRASRYLLGHEPLKEIHYFMDGSAQRYGAGHHLMRHDFRLMALMKDLYGTTDPLLGKTAVLEVSIHIALDKGLINLTDVSLMSDLTRVLARKGGRRRHFQE